jgi:hypothetical protein
LGLRDSRKGKELRGVWMGFVIDNDAFTSVAPGGHVGLYGLNETGFKLIFIFLVWTDTVS